MSNRLRDQVEVHEIAQFARREQTQKFIQNSEPVLVSTVTTDLTDSVLALHVMPHLKDLPVRMTFLQL